MDYKEIYETLNNKQRNVLRIVIDRALAMKAPSEAHITTASMLALYPVTNSCLNLNHEQFTLFWYMVRYIILNKERIKEVIYEAMKKEFFDSIDQLMAKHYTISPISDGSNALDVKLDSIDETDLYFANHKED